MSFRVFIFYIFACAALLLALMYLVPGLRAQESPEHRWIHENRPDCCNHRECQPAHVTMTFTGWRVEGADNVVPFAYAIRWPFGVPYACIAGGYVRCLFIAEAA